MRIYGQTNSPASPPRIARSGHLDPTADRYTQPIEDGPPRRYYRLNDAGEAMLAELTAIWNALTATMAGLLEEGKVK